jgi:hypothetical protein
MRLWINLKSSERFLEAHAEARKKGGRNRTKEQSCQALADCPARRGGRSARATRTVRQIRRTVRMRTADCLAWAAGCLKKPTKPPVATPGKTDRPRGARGPSARHPRTVRASAADRPKPSPTKTQNQNGSKAKPSKNTKNTRRTLLSRTVRHNLADCPRLTGRGKNCSTPKVNSPNSSPDLPNGRSYWDKSLGTW